MGICLSANLCALAMVGQGSHALRFGSNRKYGQSYVWRRWAEAAAIQSRARLRIVLLDTMGT